MALRIKKKILDERGETIEVEGTEAEVEAFENKLSKKKQTEEKARQKRLLLEGKKKASEMTLEDLFRLIERLLKERVAEHHYHHWYRYNDWWYRPLWYGDHYVWCTTNTDPTSGKGVIATCNSLEELGQRTGVDAYSVYSSLLTGPQPQNAWNTWSNIKINGISTGVSSGCINTVSTDKVELQNNYSNVGGAKGLYSNVDGAKGFDFNGYHYTANDEFTSGGAIGVGSNNGIFVSNSADTSVVPNTEQSST